MKITFLFKSSLDSLGRQATNVLRIAASTDGSLFRLLEKRSKLQTFLHKIPTESLHQRRLTNKHECKAILSSSKISKILIKHSVESWRDIVFFKKKFQPLNTNSLVIV